MLKVLELECWRGDNRLFSGVSFSVAPGTALFVHGPNGSGKTTLLRTLCGLVMPESGDILWEGSSIRNVAEEYHAKLSYFGHLNGLKEELTGVENLRFSAQLAGVDVSDSAISDALSKLGVEICQDLPTKVLSQGQKKRVALARFLLAKTQLWVLDEPFTALDVHAVDVLSNEVASHVSGGGMAIFTTHQDVAIPRGNIQHIHLK